MEQNASSAVTEDIVHDGPIETVDVDECDRVQATNDYEGLPVGWIEAFDEDTGRAYYFNESQNVTQWERPASEVKDSNGDIYPENQERKDRLPFDDVGTDTQYLSSKNVDTNKERESVFLPDGWVKVIDNDSDVPYYFNEATNEAQWEPPTNPPSEGSVDFITSSTQTFSASSRRSEQYHDESTFEHKEINKSKWDSESNHISDPCIILPPGWVQVTDDQSGKIYYLNEKDGKTQLDLPLVGEGENSNLHNDRLGLANKQDDWVKVSAPVSSTDLNQDSSTSVTLPPDWEALEDPSSGQIYYFNKVNSTTTWDIPTANIDANNSDGYQECRLRPAHSLVSFGFGGKLLVMKPLLAEPLGIGGLSGGGPTLRKGPVHLFNISSIVPERFLPVKSSARIPSPLLSESDVDVNLMLEAMSGDKCSDNELLWNLISIASRWKGILRSTEGVANPNSPEAAVVSLLLNSSYELPNPSLTDLHHSKVQDSKNCMAEIQKLLLHGHREEAVKCALSGGNYGLALLIASFCGPDTYHTAMKYFIKKELASGTPLHTTTSLFANQIQTHSESDDDYSYFWKNDSIFIEHNWRHHLASILSNQTRGWKKVVVTLGDELLYKGNTNAAHFCYLASGRPISSLEDPASRLVLIGCDHRISRNLELLTKEGIEAYFRTEALEWAKRKGNPLAVITAFQPFKLKYAMILADHGFKESALAYIESVRKCTGLNAFGSCEDSMSSNMYPKWFLENLDIFEDRLLISLGKVNPRAEKRKHISMFGLSGVLSKVVSTTNKDEPVTDSVVNIDGSFDYDMDLNDTYVSASSKNPEKFNNEASKSTASVQCTNPFAEERLQMREQVKEERNTSKLSDAFTPNRPADDTTLVVSNIQDSKISTPVTMTRNDISSVASNSTATPAAKKPIVEAPSSASSWSISNWLTKKLNPEATQADIGGEMEAYYDEKLKRWIFPGDDPTEIAKPLAPPPTTPVVKDTVASAPMPATNDPLASLMAPPTRSSPSIQVSSMRHATSTVGSRTPIAVPPRIPRSTHSMSRKVEPPQFVIFEPKKEKEKERHDF